MTEGQQSRQNLACADTYGSVSRAQRVSATVASSRAAWPAGLQPGVPSHFAILAAQESPGTRVFSSLPDALSLDKEVNHAKLSPGVGLDLVQKDLY